jgi:two-component system, cell cycle sensor histidine kinase and response regulator CckA
MRRGTTNTKDLLFEIAGLREQLADARRTIQDLQGRGAIAVACGDLPAATSMLAPLGECVALGTDGDRTAQAQECFKFYHVFTHAKASMAILDTNGCITEQNVAHRALLGYSDTELIGKTPGHYLEGGRDEFGRTMDDLLQWGSYCGEARCRSRSGHCVEVELSVAIIRNGAGDIAGYMIFILDVTEKKRMEGALRESEERFAAFMNSSSVVALMRDLKGRYVYVNRAYEKLVGKLSSEILGRTLYEIWPPEIAKEHAEADQKVLSAGHAMELHETTALPGGETKEWLTIKFPFRDRRGHVFVGGVSIDITERKSLEDQLRQSQKMEAVGRLAGGIAHDFNNLLTIIMGYSEILLGSSRIDEDEKRKILELKKAGERAALLTRQLLAFSRRQVMAPRVLDLNVVVGNLRKMIGRLIGEDVELVTIPHAPLNMVKADPGQVEQIIMNLVVNARDAMPHGGKLTIETANIEFGEEYSRSHLPCLPGHYVMIAVSDTGDGMDLETQKHIFEPFFTTKETGKGTGLGLATVYGIVKQSGGFIWVYSEPGVGSVFKVYFPRVMEQMELLPEAQQEPGRFQGTETILVAEDEAALRKLICETLTMHGYKVLQAADGKEAARRSERYRGPIHLLIADVVMPRISGRELAERITSSRPETGVLYISGYTDDAIIQHGVIPPNTSFLQKPFSPASLARKVWLILNKNSSAKS